MGMYDEFVIDKCKCKNCGKNINDIVQTKDFECLLSTWNIGDYIYEDVSLDLYEEAWCESCGHINNVLIRVRKGFYVDCILAEEYSNDTPPLDVELLQSIKNRNIILTNEVSELHSKIFRINKYLDYNNESKNNRVKSFLECIIQVDDLGSKSFSTVVKEILE